MKKIVLLSSIIFLLFSSCKKDKENIYKVKYTVTGNSVNQFKITQGGTDNFVSTPFSGTKDTTVYLSAGVLVKLDTKADNNNLVGTIYVNDVLKVTATDTDLDGDSKTQVKIEYGLPQQ